MTDWWYETDEAYSRDLMDENWMSLADLVDEGAFDYTEDG